MLYYLASPYTHPNAIVRTQRVIKAKLTAAALTQKGYTVLSPIVYYDELVQIMPGHGHDFAAFEKHNKRMINACHAMLVLRIQGWLDSVGVQAEIAYCREKNKRVIFIDYEDIESGDVFETLKVA